MRSIKILWAIEEKGIGVEGGPCGTRRHGAETRLRIPGGRFADKPGVRYRCRALENSRFQPKTVSRITLEEAGTFRRATISTTRKPDTQFRVAKTLGQVMRSCKTRRASGKGTVERFLVYANGGFFRQRHPPSLQQRENVAGIFRRVISDVATQSDAARFPPRENRSTISRRRSRRLFESQPDAKTV